MKLSRTTILAVVLVVLCGWRGFQWHEKQKIHHGFPITLSYRCSYPESFNVLGDDRQVVVRFNADKGMAINETPFSQSQIGNVMEKIYSTRNYKLVWFQAAPEATCGEAIQALASLRSDKTGAVVAVSTASQLDSKTRDANGFIISFSPHHPPSHSQ